jgi:hypothetical protein|tara:strand:+ start:4060 stop:4410 length:351 start_codon:yes stop_codon:yes gene_type:complete
MLYKSLFFLTLSSFFNQAYELRNIECVKWLPGTNEVLPAGVELAPEFELMNRVRCYCEIVKQKEAECISRQIPKNICLARTKRWVEQNLKLPSVNISINGNLSPIPRREYMISVQP